jgi:cytochrome c oxidase subunit 2
VVYSGSMFVSRRSALVLPALVGFLSLLALPSVAAQGTSTSQEHISSLFAIVLLFAVGIGVFVGVAMVYTILKFRIRKGHTKPLANPKTGDHRLEAAWTIIPAVILLVVGILAFETLSFTDTVPQQADVVVTVTGHQWYWSYNVTYANGTSATFTNDLALKANQTVKLFVEAADVAHSFFIPALALHVDAIPGHVNEYWFKPTQPGTYTIVCTQFCGVSHYTMVGTLTVEP